MILPSAGPPGCLRTRPFATKPALARQLITGALDARSPAGVGDRRRGVRPGPAARAELARRRLGYVLAVANSHPVTTAIGARPAIELARRLPARA